jgi:AcrR family transcriptional regulator
MARPRTLPDADVYAAIRALLAEGGEKAVAFGSVARATGLAAPTLAQRYGSVEGMLTAALLDEWDLQEKRLAELTAAAAPGPKGVQAILKGLGPGPAAYLRDAVLRTRAAAFRAKVETALSVHLGGGGKAREAAGMLFAAWQGQLLWQRAGDKSFKIKDMMKRLG